MGDVLQEILERIVRVETKIDGYNNLRDQVADVSKVNDVQEEKIKTLNSRVDKMEDNQRWLWRTAVGAIIVAIITGYLAWKGLK